jgi:glycerol-3-phosphate dehydrogenase subunit C
MSNEHNHRLDHCLKCSICHTQCPVLANYLSFPGPKQLGPETERLRLARGEHEILEIDNVLSYCTNCKRCDMACPHGVTPSFYNLKNKGRVKNGVQENFRDWILAHNVWWGKIAGKIPVFSNFALSFPVTKFGMGLVGIANRKFPSYKKLNFRINKEKKEKKILYFPGCYANFNEPEIIQATIDILEACGYYIELAQVECCGTPMLTNTLFDEVKKLAEKNCNIFLKYIKEGYKIVTTCPSCGLTLKQEYKDLVDNNDIEEITKNMWDLFELLSEEASLPFNSGKEKIKKAFYHIPCHLKAQGTGYPAGRILKEFAVEELQIEDEYCCGIAGTYGFKKEKHELAMKIGDSLFNAVKESSSPLVITDCGTCSVQIHDGTKVEVKHPAVVLAEYIEVI